MNVLAFFAHPDDETMLAGGILALLAKNGAQVHYVSATRGEGGEMGEPPICTREELGEVREKELVCAVQALKGRSLTFLGYVDPAIGPDDTLYAYTDNLTLLAGQLDASIRQFGIDVVITHGSNGEYGHPAHLLSHQAALVALESFSVTDPKTPAPFLYTAAASFPGHPRPRLTNKDDPADLVVDITPVRKQKEDAALCHRTQHALFVRRPSEEAGRKLAVSETILLLEGLRRVIPAGEDLSGDPLVELLEPYLWKTNAEI
ncbi:MAG: PIG-L deacetylase family protein [Omnitrophica WOR_2 bacterium]